MGCSQLLHYFTQFRIPKKTLSGGLYKGFSIKSKIVFGHICVPMAQVLRVAPQAYNSVVAQLLSHHICTRPAPSRTGRSAPAQTRCALNSRPPRPMRVRRCPFLDVYLTASRKDKPESICQDHEEAEARLKAIRQRDAECKREQRHRLRARAGMRKADAEGHVAEVQN